MEGNSMDAKIARTMAKNKNKPKQDAVNLFGNNTETNKTETKAKFANEEEDEDYVIDQNVVDTNVARQRIDQNINVNENGWVESKKAVVYEKVEVKEEPKKKNIGWGDSITENKKVAAPIDESQMYFPEIGDEKAKENAPKPKKTEAKNAGLFRGTDDDAGNWKPATSTNKFSANDGAIRFTNSKGNTEK